MEELTKTQIVLVTLLVSFITSIATGIVTVTLMDQAPPAFTQTVNRVVERTIETVVQEPVPTDNVARVIEKETIVVKEDDQAVKAINENKPSIVKVLQYDTILETTGTVASLGLILTADGYVVADAGKLATEGVYIIETADGEQYESELVSDDGNNLAFLKMVSEDSLSLDAVRLGNSNNISLGQVVIAIGGRIKTTVNTGIVASLNTFLPKPPPPVEVVDPFATSTESVGGDTENEEVVEDEALKAIDTTIGDDFITAGGPLINLSGDVVGITTVYSRQFGFTSFTPSNDVAVALDEVIAGNLDDSGEVVIETEDITEEGSIDAPLQI